MKWSFASVGLIVAGLIGITIIMLFEQITTNNESDYYLLKEITEASMVDAIDIKYYRETGDLKIVREKFVENFTRRFAESTLLTGTGYKISFYDIIETPPKVSVIVNTGLGQYRIFQNTDEYNVTNKLDAILEYVGKNTYSSSYSDKVNNTYKAKTLKKTYYYIEQKNNFINSISTERNLKTPGELIAPNIKNIRITNIRVLGNITSQGELNKALLNETIDYNDRNPNYMTSSNTILQAQNIAMIYYNCNTKSGTNNNSFKCNNSNKIYWIKPTSNQVISTNDSNKVNIVYKYEITWSYDEYEFKD